MTGKQKFWITVTVLAVGYMMVTAPTVLADGTDGILGTLGKVLDGFGTFIRSLGRNGS